MPTLIDKKDPNEIIWYQLDEAGGGGRGVLL
jgi:hypothetical protein